MVVDKNRLKILQRKITLSSCTIAIKDVLPSCYFYYHSAALCVHHTSCSILLLSGVAIPGFTDPYVSFWSSFIFTPKIFFKKNTLLPLWPREATNACFLIAARVKKKNNNIKLLFRFPNRAKERVKRSSEKFRFRTPNTNYRSKYNCYCCPNGLKFFTHCVFKSIFFKCVNQFNKIFETVPKITHQKILKPPSN